MPFHGFEWVFCHLGFRLRNSSKRGKKTSGKQVIKGSQVVFSFSSLLCCDFSCLTVDCPCGEQRAYFSGVPSMGFLVPTGIRHGFPVPSCSAGIFPCLHQFAIVSCASPHCLAASDVPTHFFSNSQYLPFNFAPI